MNDLQQRIDDMMGRMRSRAPKRRKPRARWCPYGRGYWVVRSTYNDWTVQGIGFTIESAYLNWHEELCRCLKGYYNLYRSIP